MELLKLCLRLSNTYLKGRLEHRMQFIMDPMMNVISYSISFFSIWILVSKFGSIAGWNFYEIMLLFNMNLFGYGVAGFFFYVPMVYLGRSIQRGIFDHVLLKPMNPLLYLVCSSTNNTLFGHIFLSSVALIFTFAHLAIAWSFGKVLFLLLALFGSITIHIAFLLIAGSFSFWTSSPNSFRDTIFQNARSIVHYPLNIYGKIFQVVLTFIIPFAFVGFYPAQYLLGKGPTLFHPILQYSAPVVGVGMCLGAYQFWRAGINHYESTGS
ncbi:MAG: ABC-2 family transporter protein [Dehalococcoidales bacterium]|nr:ABC-2 family transporter protein [Dehalococcoidales bacterium]